ncbi:hypothetical protein [Bacillus coahuilensis]|uniref:hypothetical protein n=1 Tax=Bacillus coahuilensis TaxID=408580 RepID=UPI0001850726|nr:hypothetical protein [Bacillus coahuilensis]
MLSVSVNSIIVTEMPDGTLLRQRILWVDDEGYDCFIIDIDDEKALPVYRQFSSIQQGLDEKEQFIELVDPYFKVIHEEDIPEKHKTGVIKIGNIYKKLFLLKKSPIYLTKKLDGG